MLCVTVFVLRVTFFYCTTCTWLDFVYNLHRTPFCLLSFVYIL